MTTEASTSSAQNLARKSVYSIFWNYASFGVGKLLVFVTTAVLARLLTPDDFGLVAFATLAVSYLSILKDLGLGVALIQRRQNVEDAANTVFTLNLLLGLGLTVVGIIIAPFVAIFFREPSVTPILRWLSCTFVLNALGSVHIVRLQRELAFHRKLVPDLGSSVLKGVVSIGLALSGYGVWSLVIGQLAGVIAGVILAWIVFPWRPRLSINSGLAAGLLSYGLSVVGINGLAIATDNLDYLIIGRAFGNTSLGIYTLAFRLPELLVLNPLWVMAAAIFPAYATVQDQPDLLRRGFLVTVRFVGILCVPLSLGLLLVADPLVRVAFGEQWLAAIPIVRILSLFVLVRSIGFNAGDVYKAVGRPDILVKLEVLNMVVLVLALWVGAYFGLIGVACGHLLASLVRMVADLLVASRFVKVSVKEILLQLKPSFLGGLVLVLLALPALYFTANGLPLLRLLVTMMIGAIGYLTALWFLEQELLLRIGRMLNLPGLGQKLPAASLDLTSSSDL
jgi:O-antigen/teichoic acid export membrane protein